MSRAFAPSLGPLAAAIAGRPLSELWKDPRELARMALAARQRTEATHVLFPFDELVLAEAAGVQISWAQGAPTIRIASTTVQEIDAEVILQKGRVPAAIEASAYVWAEAPVAANIPSPHLLLRQLGPAEREETLLDCSVACAALTRDLLKSGASMVVVSTLSDADKEVTPIARLAQQFQVPLVLRSDSSAVILPVSSFYKSKPNEIEDAFDSGATVVLTEGPLPSDVNLGVVVETARLVIGS